MADRIKKLKTSTKPQGEKTKDTIKKGTTVQRERGRPKSSTRVKFTTALEKTISDALKIEAIKRGKKPADIIELALSKELGLPYKK